MPDVEPRVSVSGAMETKVEYLRHMAAVLYNPRRALRALKHHPSRMRYGVVSLFLHSFLAMAKQLYFHLINQPVAPPPFLNVPAKQAWLYSAYFQIPVDFVQAIVFAGSVTLIAPLVEGDGSFEGQFSLYSCGFVPPTVVLMIGTLLLNLIGLSGTVLWSVFFGAVMVWITALICLTVSVAQGVDYKRALACGLMGTILSLAISLTYIR
jgi:hypothetical protein